MSQEQQQDAGLHFLDYWRVLKNRKEIILAIILLVVLTGTAVTFMMPKLYESTCRIKIEEDKTDMDVFERTMMSQYNPYFIQSEFEVIKSRPNLQRIVEDENMNLTGRWGKLYNEDESPLELKESVDLLDKMTTLEHKRSSSVIDITVRSREPDEASDLANLVAETYKKSRLDGEMERIKNALNKLEVVLDSRSEILQKLIQVREDIRVEENISIVYEDTTLDNLAVRNMQDDLSKYNIEMVGLEASLSNLEKLNGVALYSAFSTLPDFNVDPSLVNTHSMLLEARVQKSEMLKTLLQNHPDVQTINSAIEEYETQFTAGLTGMMSGVRTRLETVKSQHAALKEEFLAIERKELLKRSGGMVRYERANEKVENEREIVEGLRSRVATESSSIQMPRTRLVQIFERAEPETKPVSPNLLLNILLSLAVGTILGIGLAYFLEYLDTSVKTVDDIENFLGLPVIGVIPQKVKTLNLEGPDSPSAESYRLLRTNLHFYGRENGEQSNGGVYTLVSAGAGEGKSTTCFNLSYICASMGDRTLVIDGDLRRPVQHTHFNRDNSHGLTDVLLDNVPPEQMIQASDFPNLDFMPSGRLPNHSIGLMDAHKVRALIAKLRLDYTYIFFDAPPIMGVSDASIIASEVDGVMQVVQYRKYPRNLSARAKRVIENVGGKLVGVVLNNINVMRDEYYSYFDSYYTKAPDDARQAPAPKISATSGKHEDRF